MNAALLRFYLVVVATVLLLFFSLNQIYLWFMQQDSPSIDAGLVLSQVYNASLSNSEVICHASATLDCSESLFVIYPQSYWQGVQPSDQQVITLKGAQGNIMLCNKTPDQRLLCLHQLNQQSSTEFKLNLAHVFLLLLMLAFFFVSRNLFADLEVLRRSALSEIKQGALPSFQLSRSSYLKPLAVSLQRMNEQIKQLTGLQKEMADTVCHDIKTPLARLKFVSHSLRHKISTEEAGLIQLNLQEIEQNVYDYLRLAQQDFMAELNLTEFDVHALLHQIADPYRCSTEHQIELRSISAPMLIKADQTLLSRAINNLLVNALAYCQSRIWLETTAGEQQLTISVSDDGKGWQQTKTTADLVPEHHGLGLAIVRRVAQQHEGFLQQKHNTTGGATLELTIKTGQVS